MQFPVVAAFSPDSKFVYVLDDMGPGEAGQGAVTTFRIKDGKLELVACDEGKDGCYGGRAVWPSTRAAKRSSSRAHGPARSSSPTATRNRQDESQAGRQGRRGRCSWSRRRDGSGRERNGRFVYVSSGRFQGDDAVSVFQAGADGRLILVQEFLNDKEELSGFEGGNHLAISPDGLNVYATATRSGAMAGFVANPVSGRLTYLETTPDGGTGGPTRRSTAVAVSADNRFVYVPTEDKKSISIFQRNAGGSP